MVWEARLYRQKLQYIESIRVPVKLGQQYLLEYRRKRRMAITEKQKLNDNKPFTEEEQVELIKLVETIDPSEIFFEKKGRMFFWQALASKMDYRRSRKHLNRFYERIKVKR